VPERPPHRALFLITFCGFLLRLWVALHRPIDYDGYWHLFIARQDSWAELASEIPSIAHPPLFFILLRPLALAWHSPLSYRTVSLLAGAGVIFLAGLLVWKAAATRTGALLTSAILALSWTSVEIATDVRSYALMVFWLLLASYFWLRLIDSNLTRDAAMFGVTASLAVLSHYAAPIYLIALVAAFAITRHREFLTKSSLPKLALALAIPAIVSAAVYVVHARAWASPLSHLPSHYFNPASHESISGFLTRNTLFLARTFWPRWLRLPAMFVFVIAIVVLGFRALPRLARPWLLLPCFLFVGLALAGLAGKYPFGGAMRQQYFLAVAFTITTGAVIGIYLDRLPAYRTPLALALLAIPAATLAESITWDLHTPETPGVDQARSFHENFPDATAVYVDRHNLIPFFAQHHTWNWRFLKQTGSARMYELQKGSRKLLLIRDSPWNPEPWDPSTLSAASQAVYNGQSKVVLYVQRQAPVPGIDAPQQLLDKMQNPAQAHGLRITRIVSKDGVRLIELSR
jgi:hypothetical protein